MPWATTRQPGTNPKYQTREHRAEVARLKRELQRLGVLWCTATVCVFESRAITNPRGRDRDGLHAGHNDDGVTYAGPQHNACNVKDGARRGNARSRGSRTESTRWVL